MTELPLNASSVASTSAGPLAKEDEESTRLRIALDDMPDDVNLQGRWWGSENGAWLFEHVSTRVGSTLAARLSRQYGASFDSGDVANSVVLVLSKPSVLNSLRNASNQWAYLYRTMQNEMTGQMGTRGISGVNFDQVVIPEDVALEVTSNVEQAISRTVAALSPLTPVSVRAHLTDVISYFADRGQSRLSHVHTAGARDEELTSLGLSRRQILALANVILGARPHHGKTSILAGFLMDSEWNPAASVEHRAALRKYHARMLRETATNDIENLAVAE